MSFLKIPEESDLLNKNIGKGDGEGRVLTISLLFKIWRVSPSPNLVENMIGGPIYKK